MVYHTDQHYSIYFSPADKFLLIKAARAYACVYRRELRVRQLPGNVESAEISEGEKNFSSTSSSI